MTEKDRSRYETEMKAYIPPVIQVELKPTKNAAKPGKPEKDENAPKRPLSPFFNYQGQQRPILKAANP